MDSIRRMLHTHHQRDRSDNGQPKNTNRYYASVLGAKGIIVFESSDGDVSLPVRVDARNEEVWLNRRQLASLYGRDVKTIGKHIHNALKEELSEQDGAVVANFATTAEDGKPIESSTTTLMSFCP